MISSNQLLYLYTPENSPSPGAAHVCGRFERIQLGRSAGDVGPVHHSVYPVFSLQKYFVQGIATTGMKG